MVSHSRPLTYPPARRVEQIDEYHGVAVADPYRWLEDPDTPEARTWITAENLLTEQFLSEVPARNRIRARLTELWDYERYSAPFHEGNRWFFFKNDGLQNQDLLYTQDGLDAEPRVLLDPNTLSADGTVSLSSLDISRDGSLLAYGISRAGSDWQELRVRSTADGVDHTDVIRWVKFSGAAWSHDGSGFYYARYDEPDEGRHLEDTNYFQKLFFHPLGAPQSADVLVYDRPDDKELGFNPDVSDDGRYLVINVWRGTDERNRLYYVDLAAAPTPGSEATVVRLLDDNDAGYTFIDNDGPLFWFRTDLDAPRGRLIAIDVRQPEREHWHEVIAERAETLESVSVVGERFFASYLRDAWTVVRVHHLDGRFEREVTLPGVGTAGGFGGDRTDAETFYLFTSFTEPATIYRYDIATDTSTVFRRPQVKIQPEDFESRQVFVTSKDGTRIPLFITHRKGLQLDGTNAVYLYGYGGFNIPLVPSYSTSVMVWMELGGVFAQACLRGGGEYGEAWHQAGMKANKQNVFDDFIACAEWLIGAAYTAPPKLAIGGGSNGGLLVGACMVQRPDLFGAALPAVGVMDMLRFHQFTIGWGWTSDYGSPDDPEEFGALYAYSPYHNLHPGTAYPATLITTGDHDDRVVPAHSFKFAAALQHAHGGTSPVLIRIETQSGHGAGKPTAKVIEEAADRWTFLVAVLGMDTTG